jgi:hypothetical protein
MGRLGLGEQLPSMSVIRWFLIRFVLCALAIAFCTVFGEGSLRSWRSTGNTEQQLIKLNEHLVAAEVRRDMNALDDLFTADYVHVHTNGWVESRADFLNDFKSGKRIYHSVDLHDVHAQVYHQTALIVGNAHVRSMSGSEKDNLNRFLAVWVQQQGKWRLAAWVTTRLQDQRTPWSTGAGNDVRSHPND